VNADELLSERVVEAAVSALAERNREQVLRMDPGEREAMLAHWRGVALDVLAAARAAVEAPAGDDGPRGRAVIVIEDDGARDLDVHAAFFPELDEADDHFIGTAAQAAAVEVLKAIAGQKA
jgi:hypothetical protein